MSSVSRYGWKMHRYSAQWLDFLKCDWNAIKKSWIQCISHEHLSLDTCNGPNVAVGKVFKTIKQSQILDVLTKHDVYNICYCRGKGCHQGKKRKIE